MPLVPSPQIIPYFSGPQDVSQLQNYLNQLIRLMNAVLWSLITTGFPQIVAPLVTITGQSWDGSAAFVPISSNNGDLVYTVAAGFATGIDGKQVIIFLIPGGSGSVTIRDGLGTTLAFLSSAGQAFALCVSTATGVYSGNVT